MKPLVSVALLSGAALAVYALWREGLSKVASPFKASPDFEPLKPKPVSAEKVAVYKQAAATMQQAAQSELGRDLTDTELSYCLAVAKLETGFGRGWKGAMVGSNNWGAVQCSASNQDGAGCIPYEDSYADGTKYKINFRSYATPVDGARDVIKHVMVHRPTVAKVLASPDCTIYRASLAMRRTTYYGGFCPKTVSRYGTMGRRTAQRNPETDAEKSCEHEAVDLHAAKAVAPIAAELATALGTSPMVLGSYEDALKALYQESPVPVAGTLSILEKLDTERDITWRF